MDDFVEGCLGLIFTILICGAVIFGLVKFTEYLADKYHCGEISYSDGTTTELYAGFNNSETQGTFLLGSGNVSSEDILYFWVDTGSYIEKRSVLMEDAIFVEDGLNIMVEQTPYCVDNPKSFIRPHNRYEFHVPEGSIIKIYEFK